MASTRILSIVGRKNAGKTTLTVALASELARRGRRVMTLKHTHHPVEVDRQGSDSWRHFHEGRAERSMIVAPNQRVLFERAADEYDPVALARRYMADADIVLAEGYKQAPIPKIEVFRPSVAPTPIYDPDAPDAALWTCIVTDDLDFEAACKVVRFQDTMWLQLLASLTIESAQAIDG
ncbi:MAG: molybdopterin-guanine dinucleotide biosynthesis protein B [Gemmatimonadales bacterium]